MPQYRKIIFFALFFLSGFSGLIYQSIWSHYLKLFLGHAAYAQTLVLAIFMGGMAVGSLLSGLFLHRWRVLLIGYAVVELIIGVLAIMFHPIFVTVTDLTFTHLISGLGDSPFAVTAIKWGVASLLIFPQSVLLGMTFPLMVGGILRHFPAKPGYTLSMLYFTNSFGAVFGVLASSFVFIGWVGLPGTMLTAGLMNIALAIAVWTLAKNYADPKESQSDIEEDIQAEPEHFVQADQLQVKTALVSTNMLLFIAFFTGLSSFMYEIGWIRMLVLVLGGSTHSFELMLASFILGIALGGFWIRNRIDNFTDSRAVLGYVQIAMGIAAILSLWLYHYSFDWMSYLMDSIQRKASTYNTYLLFSGMISMMIMLPATFFAGMTLPLITRLIIKTKEKENGIGYVYSANTLGAIIGIFLSVHIVLPIFGLRNLIFIGAATDLLLGLYLLRYNPLTAFTLPSVRSVVAGLSIAMCFFSLAVVKFDANRLSSGVFRTGEAEVKTNTLFHSDGKTSTVTVSEHTDIGMRVIKNNGKPDASIVMDPDAQRSSDESTQILISAYPLFQKPEAKTAAIIGMGSGMSTHTILGSNTIELVDTIEIEEKIIEGARYFLPANDRAYSDPRSELHVEDAKTFFSSHGKQYDIVISEPPNPWVSGVSTLFSQEFYSRVKRHLNPGGIFAQWIHLYEIDINLVATVFNALDLEFEDYVVYQTSQFDILIMASADRELAPLSEKAFEFRELRTLLDDVHIKTSADLELNRIGSRRILSPLFRQLATQANSDYFPILDKGAPKARFAGHSAESFVNLGNSSIPVLKFLENREIQSPGYYSDSQFVSLVREKTGLLEVIDMLISQDSTSDELGEYAAESQKRAVLIDYYLSVCDVEPEQALKAIVALGHRVVALMSKEEQAPLWRYLAQSECLSDSKASVELINWIDLFVATSERQYADMSGISTMLLETNNYASNTILLSYLISIGVLGDAYQGDVAAAKLRWEEWGKDFTKKNTVLSLALLLSNVGVKL